MVNEPVRPFIVKMRIIVPKTGAQGEVVVIIDTDFTHCLINLPTVLKLGIQTKKITPPIHFEQVEESLIATLLTEPMRLEMDDTGRASTS